jgi:hypothetical protein
MQAKQGRPLFNPVASLKVEEWQDKVT